MRPPPPYNAISTHTLLAQAVDPPAHSADPSRRYSPRPPRTRTIDLILAIKQGDQVLGNRTRVKVVKNKLAPPFRQVEFDIVYGEGISLVGDLIDLGVEHDVVDKSGAWYSFRGDRIGQGRENAKEFLKTHGEIAESIRQAVLSKMGLADGAGADKADGTNESTKVAELPAPVPKARAGQPSNGSSRRARS